MSVNVDAIIVGVGVVGLAVARALAIQGREVIVQERHRQAGEEVNLESPLRISKLTARASTV